MRISDEIIAKFQWIEKDQIYNVHVDWWLWTATHWLFDLIYLICTFLVHGIFDGLHQSEK